jgi:hypothetical protein
MAGRGRASVNLKFSTSWVREVAGIGDPAVRRGAEMIAAAQRAAIPVSQDGSNGRPAGYARDRIAVRVAFEPGIGKVYNVGSDATTPDGVAYPVILDAGSSPHIIESHGDYPLRDKHGHVFGRVVHHPGTAPTYWCRNSIRAILGRTL